MWSICIQSVIIYYFFKEEKHMNKTLFRESKEQITVDIERLSAMLSCGRAPALQIFKFVRIPAWLKTKPFKQLKAGSFTDDGDIESLGLPDDVVGVVGFVYGDADAVGLGR